MRILIVEDDAEQREVLTRVLSRAKGGPSQCFDVATATSRKEAEATLAAEVYDFVLLDYCLEHNNRESMALSKALSKKNIPHAFYTANVPMIKTGNIPIGIPIWQKAEVGVSLDLVTKICDHYGECVEAAAETAQPRSFLGIPLPRLKKIKAQ